jgi:hypothetical protein
MQQSTAGQSDWLVVMAQSQVDPSQTSAQTVSGCLDEVIQTITQTVGSGSVTIRRTRHPVSQSESSSSFRYQLCW